MPRIATRPGSHTDPEATPYRLDPGTGRRVRVAGARQATLWRARCTAVLLDGSRKDVTRWAKTKRDALEAVAVALENVKRTNPGSLLRPSMPFVEAGRLWLADIQRPGTMASAATIDAYARAWRVHIDAPGSILRGVTLAGANDVQVILAFLQAVADSKGASIAKRCKTILSNVLSFATERGVLPHSVARLAPPVRTTKRVAKRDHSRGFTEQERAHVLATADQQAADQIRARDDHELADGRVIYSASRSAAKWDTVADLMAFLAGTGVRINEARLLRWEHLDLPDARVQVFGTKSESSERVLSLPGWLVERLIARAVRRGQTGYAFASFFDPESPLDPSNLETSVRQILDSAGCSWAISHTFRRTVASMLHAGGVPLVGIADQLGHADPSVTARVYLGRDPKGDKSAFAALL